MSGYSLLIDCKDFKEGDEYLFLDAVLCSSCFADVGPAYFGVNGRRREFRRFAAKFYPNVLVPESATTRKERRLMLRVYSPDHDPIMDQVLASYGVRMSGIVEIGITMKEFLIPDMALPTLALLCKGEVKPSQRAVADAAYRNWIEYRTHGDDVTNWLTAEAEMFERLEGVVKGLV